MTNSRRKGHDGEREIAGMLREGLDIPGIHRNWMAQSVDGGPDIVLDNWAVEIKRAKVPLINNWWTQCATQAAKCKKKPVLMYRLDRQDWRVMMSMHDLRPDLEDFSKVTMDFDSWINLVRRE